MTKTEHLAAAKIIIANGLKKSGATGEALAKAEREAAAMVEILEGMDEAEFAAFDGPMKLIQSVFIKARAEIA